ncbi:MAG TPA: anhydro-N-acetylmuramic acid kinase [candidate division Zixibacteria bacterium]|nr:anhydro-N-acetylmuramic acid kinase [candidate division Zixibacteria bacterium]
MSLEKIMAKRRLVILGLNSGTSADGVDLAAMSISRTGNHTNAKFIRGQSIKYPPKLRTRILDLADSGSTTLDEVIAVDNAIGAYFGQCAQSFQKRLSQSGIKIDAIASHGQTVRHIPTPKNRSNLSRGTMQLGSLEMISTASKKITVGDFRQADIALGNEGAPITVAAMQRLFASKSESRLIVNIGGISNYFYFPLNRKDLRALAGDCGPGNSLCDILSQKLFRKKFDSNGRNASKGKPSKRILTLLLADDAFKNKSNSTGRESFGNSFAQKIIALGKKFRLSNSDLISTAAELTVIAILNKIKPLVQKDRSLSKLYLTGGGRKNRFFVKRLRELLKGVKVLNADQLGINADYIEAASYAVMGEAALRGEPLPTLFDTKKRGKLIPILGKIVQPPVIK